MNRSVFPARLLFRAATVFSFSALSLGVLLTAASCSRVPEMSLEEIEAARASSSSDLISRTVHRPKTADTVFAPGKPGGTWNTSISSDPKSFNLLVAEADGSTTSVLSYLTTYLADYDIYNHEWKSGCASFEITIDEAAGTLDVTYTLRDDLYWSYYEDAYERVPVTSDDVVFWYNDIQGDAACASSAWNSRFLEKADGTVAEVTIEKIDDKRFVFHFPVIVAEPVLHSNMNFGPAFLYKKAKDAGGAEAVRKLFTVDTDPRTIPSCGPYFLAEYTPSQRLVYKRNPLYWQKDAAGENHYYPEEIVAQIVGDNNTAYLLFTQHKLESYVPSPEQLESVIAGADNLLSPDGTPLESEKKDRSGYTVFNADGGMSASFWSFNQNPQNKDEPYYRWFTKKEFRQAMSCLLNRERIISQTYRGIGEPTYSFFPKINRYYDENIILQYRYSHEHARRLLASAGFVKGSDGFLYDDGGNRVSFDISYAGTAAIFSDVAQIIVDECKKEGITVTPRPTDFQKLVDELTGTYEWQSVLIGFGGGNVFPTQGPNVWLSKGNMHLWYPLQEKPATDWEARVDELYQTAKSIVDYEKAKPYWDEYQRIFLEQCPIIYLTRTRSFFAISNRWDMTNMYFDNLEGAQTDYLYLAE
ncbi:MAG: ABC transporter substrate-binding protein [Treponema sp.]|nr:ABC transporter substrate-binding protein [Treponema sp.]